MYDRVCATPIVLAVGHTGTHHSSSFTVGCGEEKRERGKKQNKNKEEEEEATWDYAKQKPRTMAIWAVSGRTEQTELAGTMNPPHSNPYVALQGGAVGLKLHQKFTG